MEASGWDKLVRLVDASSHSFEPEVVIVGGGASGLAAAARLSMRRVLVLETSDRLGGRVQTHRWNDVDYDVGAFLPYPQQLAPGAGGREPAPQPGAVGLHLDGVTTFGADLRAAIAARCGADELERFAAGEIGIDRLPDRARLAVAAGFNAIHPGPIECYASRYQRDGLATYRPAYRSRGNQRLIDALRSAATARIDVARTACSISRDGSRWRVTTRAPALGDAVVECAHLVLATPPQVAGRLLRGLPSSPTVDFVRSWDGVGGTVVVLFVDREAIPPFAYVVADGSAVNTVAQRRTPAATVLTTFRVGPQHDAVADVGDRELVDATIEAVESLDVGASLGGRVRHADVVRWPMMGPILGESVLEHRRALGDVLNPMDGLWITGDYTVRPEMAMPYGMAAAVAAGSATGSAVLRALDGRAAT